MIDHNSRQQILNADGESTRDSNVPEVDDCVVQTLALVAQNLTRTRRERDALKAELSQTKDELAAVKISLQNAEAIIAKNTAAGPMLKNVEQIVAKQARTISEQQDTIASRNEIIARQRRELKDQRNRLKTQHNGLQKLLDQVTAEDLDEQNLSDIRSASICSGASDISVRQPSQGTHQPEPYSVNDNHSFQFRSSTATLGNETTQGELSTIPSTSSTISRRDVDANPSTISSIVNIEKKDRLNVQIDSWDEIVQNTKHAARITQKKRPRADDSETEDQPYEDIRGRLRQRKSKKPAENVEEVYEKVRPSDGTDDDYDVHGHANVDDEDEDKSINGVEVCSFLSTTDYFTNLHRSAYAASFGSSPSSRYSIMALAPVPDDIAFLIEGKGNESSFVLSQDAKLRKQQIKGVQDLMRSLPTEKIARHKFEWVCHRNGPRGAKCYSEWLPIYKFQPISTVRDILTEYTEGLNGHLSLSELDKRWGARWRRSSMTSSLKAHNSKRREVRKLIFELSSQPGWDTETALHFLEQHFPIASESGSSIPECQTWARFFGALQRKSSPLCAQIMETAKEYQPSRTRR